MTIRKRKGGTYNIGWRNVEARARAKKRVERPKRDILAVRQALMNMKLRYCQEVSFWNTQYMGPHGTWDGGFQWVDFVVRPIGRPPFVVILDDPLKRANPKDKIAHAVKLDGLNSRGIPFILLKKGMSSMEYQVKITWQLRKMKG